MAQFTNQAQLSYNNITVNSNITVGQLLEALTATKTAVGDTYVQNGEVTYVVSLVNTGNTPIAGVSVSDDLGAYPFGTGTLTPLTYVDGSVLLYANGVPQAAPAVSTTPTLTFEGITIPANGNITLVYKATVNQFAPLDAQGSIANTATATGTGILTPVVATETITPVQGPQLSITKSLDPVVVTDNSTLTYQFVIQNYGNAAATATDNVAVTDTFDPILSSIVVTLNGATLTLGTDYTYNEATGTFATAPGLITIPAASFSQDSVTGVQTITPGTATLTVQGVV